MADTLPVSKAESAFYLKMLIIIKIGQCPPGLKMIPTAKVCFFRHRRKFNKTFKNLIYYASWLSTILSWRQDD
jgi:hypothetical protein